MYTFVLAPDAAKSGPTGIFQAIVCLLASASGYCFETFARTNMAQIRYSAKELGTEYSAPGSSSTSTATQAIV